MLAAHGGFRAGRPARILPSALSFLLPLSGAADLRAGSESVQFTDDVSHSLSGYFNDLPAKYAIITNVLSPFTKTAR